MRGKRFSSPEEAVVVYESELMGLEENVWQECFQKWFERMRKCIQCGGEYFEKLQQSD